MAKCKSCGVFVKTNKKTCPLCGDVLVDHNENEDIEFLYPNFEDKKQKQNLVLRLFNFFAIMGIITSCVVNLLINPIYSFKDFDITKYWMLVSIVGIVNVYVLVKYTILSKDNFAKRLLVVSLFLSLTVFVCDLYINGKPTFSLTYVITFIQEALLLTYIIMVNINRKLYSSYFTWIIYAIILNIMQVILIVFNLSSQTWVQVSSILFGVLTFIGMLIICPKQTKKEFSKRFHI